MNTPNSPVAGKEAAVYLFRIKVEPQPATDSEIELR